MNLPRETDQVRVLPETADSGRMSAVAKKRGRFLLRPPAWTDRAGVAALRAGKSVPARWKGDYVMFDDAEAGETFGIRFPVIRFGQRVQIGGKTYLYRWIGNRVVSVDPPGEKIGIFLR